MEVVVTKAQLDARDACGDQYSSPYWDNERQALVYPDWSAAVERLLSSRDGIRRLRFLVLNQLVPMTRHELSRARWATLAQRTTKKESVDHGA